MSPFDLQSMVLRVDLFAHSVDIRQNNLDLLAGATAIGNTAVAMSPIAVGAG
jgi:hypothetical protein